MKRKAAIFLALTMMMSVAAPTMAHRYRRADGTFDHPFHLLFLAAHPVAIGIEYAVHRPLHWVISQPDLDIVFGHKASLREEGTYFEWTHGDWSPSVAEEIASREGRAEAQGAVPNEPAGPEAGTPVNTQ